MGQQQLTLTILVVLIVGIATVVAIDTMMDSRQEANNDQIRQKLYEATTYAQMYYRKHEALGGGGESFNLITLDDVEIDANDIALGTFEITEKSEESFTISVSPAAGGDDIIGKIYEDRIEFVDPE
ncbi:MAG: hypothetical protein RI564_04985 [Gracilimonas sp.]|nr:hypothetical protein [Gracilimonas sp.]